MADIDTWHNLKAPSGLGPHVGGQVGPIEVSRRMEVVIVNFPGGTYYILPPKIIKIKCSDHIYLIKKRV